MKKSIGMFLTLLMAALAINVYGAEKTANYNLNIQNNTLDKELEVAIYSNKGDETNLYMVLAPGEKYTVPDVSIKEPASYQMYARTKDRDFKWHVGSGPLPDNFVRTGSQYPKKVYSQCEKETYEKFKDDRVDHDIREGNFGATLYTVNQPDQTEL